MRRATGRVGKATAIVALGLVGTLTGSVGAVFFTPAGRGLAGRALSERLDRVVHGDVTVGAVGGPLWGSLVVEQLSLRDRGGAELLRADRVAASYRLLDLLRGRILLHDVTLDGVDVLLEQHRDGRWNVEALFAGGDSAVPGPATPPEIALERVTIRDGRLRLRTPWSPPDSARTPRAARAALAAERARPGRVIEPGPEGYRRQVTFAGLAGRFRSLRLSTPDRAPIRARVDSLAVRVSDPGLDLRDLRGTLELRGDTLHATLARAALPATEASGGGTVGLGHGGPRWDVTFDAPRVALRDLAGIVPGVPDLAGRGALRARTGADGVTTWTVTGLDAAGRAGRVTGTLAIRTGDPRGLGFGPSDLTLAGFDPAALRGWLDSMPLEGRLAGRVRAEGPLAALRLDADVTYADARVRDEAPAHLVAAGRVALGGAAGAVFDTLELRESDIGLATAGRFLPVGPLRGRVAATGTLTGPWRRLTWRGTLLHQDGERPVSAVRGTVRVDTRAATPVLAADLGLIPVVFDGLRGAWPALPLTGDLRGTVRLTGPVDHLALAADVQGGIGHLAGTGTLTTGADGWTLDSLVLAFDSLDLRAATGRELRTQLLGRATGAIAADSLGRYTGRLAATLGAGWVREVPLDSGAVRVVVGDERVRVDTLFVRWPNGRFELGGALARRAPATDTLRLSAEAADLAPFDSLVSALWPASADTLPGVVPLGGRLALTAALTGATDSLAVEGELATQGLAWDRLRVPSARVAVRWGGGAMAPLAVLARVDTASWDGWGGNDLDFGAAGRRDSLQWGVTARLGPTDTLGAAGGWRVHGDTLTVVADTFRAALTAHAWRLAAPAVVRRVAGQWAGDTVAFETVDGSGQLRLAGSVPADSAGALELSGEGIDLRDLAGILARDTLGLRGRLGMAVRVAGTARRPTMRGTVSLSEGAMRDFQAPYVQGVFDYADRLLRGNLLLWRTGQRALAIDAALPVDLALTRVAERRVGDSLHIRAVADSADLGIAEAFSRNLRRVRGILDADVTLGGTWGATRLDGRLQVRDGAASLPGLGVRWEGVYARARFEADSVVLDTLNVRGGEGTLTGAGSVRFAARQPATIDLRVRAERFRAMDVRNFLTLVATGRLAVKGPLYGAALTGTARADQGALYFADLITKQIVDLDDPANAGLVDTALVRAERLGPSFSNRFLDSLRIDTLRVTVGEDFWLRSVDANVKLSGAAVVGKRARNYRLDGTLTAERGTYALKIGIITREFEVRRGTVRFLGTPDLNAELDLTAEHRVKTQEGPGEIPVQARITGTLLVPKLTLVNPDDPTMDETELVSYLMFGRSSLALQGTGAGGQDQRAAVTAGVSYLAAALSSELERTLVSDLGVPVDYVQIRPGGAVGSGFLTGADAGLATVTAGWQLGRRTFVSLNAGICTNISELSYRNFGASLEQRLHKDWRATLSVEPVVTCTTGTATTTLATSSPYQLGLDLLWDREY
ncbi:MAG TPA: translocation/assembly module TamB domain-containing protein [Gemmatimonadales bacterium]|nr:translocation/assembly module TamB domain-containing protein [Gemmatimonadales bacterium]